MVSADNSTPKHQDKSFSARAWVAVLIDKSAPKHQGKVFISESGFELQYHCLVINRLSNVTTLNFWDQGLGGGID